MDQLLCTHATQTAETHISMKHNNTTLLRAAVSKYQLRLAV